MKNLEFITKQIKEKLWTGNCGGKQDLDIPILSINTRYYSDFSAMPSFLLGDDDIDSDIDYKKFCLNQMILSEEKAKKIANLKSKSGIFQT